MVGYYHYSVVARDMGYEYEEGEDVRDFVRRVFDVEPEPESVNPQRPPRIQG